MNHANAKINSIGKENATVLLYQQKSKAVAFGIRVAMGTIGKIGGDDTARVEVIGIDWPIYVSASAWINEIGDNTLIAAQKLSYGDKNHGGAIWNVSDGHIKLLSGGYYAIADNNQNTVDNIFKAHSSYTTLNYVVSNMAISAGTKDVVSQADGKTYACYYIHAHYYDEDGKCIHCGKVHASSEGAIGGGIPEEELGKEVAQIIDDKAYATLELAIAAADKDDCILMLTDSADKVTINEVILIDLNGHQVSNVIIAIDGVKFMDSTANGYSEPDGRLEEVTGAEHIDAIATYALGDVTPKRYVKVDNKDGTYSFYRAAVSVTGMQFAFDTNATGDDPKAYLTFRGTVKGNETVAAMLTDLGFCIDGNDVDWYKKAMKENAEEFVMEKDAINFFYTKGLGKVNDVKNVAAVMEFGSGNTAESLKRDVLKALGEMKSKLSENENTALKEFFEKLTDIEEA